MTNEAPVRSKAVTSVAVVHFVLCALSLLLVGNGFAMILADQSNEGVLVGLGRWIGKAFMIVGALAMTATGMAGYGVWRRKTWGRILALIVAAIFGLFGLLLLMGDESDLSCVWLLFYVAFTWFILLNKSHNNEFS